VIRVRPCATCATPAAPQPEYNRVIVKLKDGRVLSGIVRNTDADHFSSAATPPATKFHRA